MGIHYTDIYPDGYKNVNRIGCKMGRGTLLLLMCIFIHSDI